MNKVKGIQSGFDLPFAIFGSAGGVLLVVGLVLILISVLGDWTPLGRIENAHPKHWDQLDPELVARTPNVSSLVAEARSRLDDVSEAEVSPAALMALLYQVTTERFVHGAGEHTLFSNWILWVRGLTRRHPIRIADSNELLQRGHTALCGQVSQLLVDMARLSGIEARIVGLHEHVVMEAFHGGGWHMYDVDAEVGPRGVHESLPSLDRLSNNPTRVAALYSDNNPQMIPLLLRSEAHSYVSDLNPDRLRLEGIAEQAKYLVPLVLIAFGWMLCRMSRSGDALKARKIGDNAN